jgi:hypothetical protein
MCKGTSGNLEIPGSLVSLAPRNDNGGGDALIEIKARLTIEHAAT